MEPEYVAVRTNRVLFGCHAEEEARIGAAATPSEGSAVISVYKLVDTLRRSAPVWDNAAPAPKPLAFGVRVKCGVSDDGNSAALGKIGVILSDKASPSGNWVVFVKDLAMFVFKSDELTPI